MEWTININNRIDEIPDAICFFEQIGRELCLSTKTITHVSLVVDEILTNILSYGYSQKQSDIIKLNVCVFDGILFLTFEDHGVEFDMVSIPQPNLSLPVETRPIGGMGIHLAKTIMDTATYKRKNSTNTLIMSKKITSYEDDN